MPWKSEYIEPEIFVEHNGVKVYRTYKYDDINAPRMNWFTLYEDFSEDDPADRAFDVRDFDSLNEIDNASIENVENIMRSIIRRAIRDGKLKK